MPIRKFGLIAEELRNASDIVLTEPRIDTLLEIVVEGRAMWTAVRDAVSYFFVAHLANTSSWSPADATM